MNEVACAPLEERGSVSPETRRYSITWITIRAALDHGAVEMFLDHWDELETNSGDADLEIDWPRLLELERLGIVRSFALWFGSEMVGYSLFYITPHVHTKSKFQATNDVIYVKPEHRRGGGIRLIREAEEKFGEAGVWRITYHVKAPPSREDKSTGDLFRRMEYRHDEEVFVKLL